MIKIAQLSDIHVRNTIRHEEYKFVFNKLYEILKEEKPNLIINCGDTAHQKSTISPEYVQLTSELAKNLGDIAPTKFILGNHDKNYKNSDRLDAVSPVINTLNHPNVEIYLKSGKYIFNNQIDLYVLYTFDRDGWVKPDNNKINIALYHGSISGCDIDSEWTMRYGEDNISILEPYDYAFLGDIHKCQYLDSDKKAYYCGSLIQQNFSEEDNKGFLIWEIESKNKHSVRHISIPNPKPFVTIELNNNGELPENLIAKNNSRVRLIARNNFPLETIRKSIDIIKSKIKPDSLIFVDKSEDKNSVFELVDKFKKEDLRNVDVQQRLIREYLKDYNVSEDLMLRVFDINNKYNLIVESNDKTARNIDFKILNFEWNNLFNYGQNNTLDFENLNGIIGLFGKNFSGKSSINESLLYTVFNSITKKNKKTINIINYNCDEGNARILLQIDNKVYRISRKSEKYIKRLYNVESVEAKSSVNFEIIDPITLECIESLNGIDGDETNQNIARIFGTKEDFMTTSMASQKGSLTYIDKGSTERKETLARFLDLDFFSEKFELANDDSFQIKSSLKRYDNFDFGKTLAEAETLLIINNKNINVCKQECDNLKNEISCLEKDIAILDDKLKQLPVVAVDINFINNNILNKENELITLKKHILECEKEVVDNEVKLGKANKFVDDFDINDLNKNNNLINQNNDTINELLIKISDLEKTLENDNEKVKLLTQVPCGPEYSHCKFIKGAYEAKNNIDIVKLVLDKTISDKNSIESDLSILNPSFIKDQIVKYNKLLNRKSEFDKDLENNKLKLLNKKSSLKILDHELSKLLDQKQEYIKNKEFFDAFDNNLSVKKVNIEKLAKLKLRLDNFEKEISEYYKPHGHLEQKIEKIVNDKNELDGLQKSYDAYDLFLKCMHTNGISYDIIKKSLPVINKEIAKNLSNVVDFEVFFQNEDNRLELYIKKPNENKILPLEMGSMAQNMLASMAIRLAFIHISSLPKSDIFILDEPATSLDADSMQGFLRMLDVVKSHFKCVLLISHLDILKDAADVVYNIEEKNGFATLTQ